MKTGRDNGRDVQTLSGSIDSRQCAQTSTGIPSKRKTTRHQSCCTRQGGSDSQDFQPLATPTDQWEILVVAGKKANALLTVDFVDGKWMPVGIGAPGLAKKLGNILEAWPASSGYQYRLICLYQISEKFIELSQGGKMIGLIPLVSSNATMGEPQKEFDPANIRDAKEVLINLWSSVLRDIQRGK